MGSIKSNNQEWFGKIRKYFWINYCYDAVLIGGGNQLDFDCFANVKQENDFSETYITFECGEINDKYKVEYTEDYKKQIDEIVKKIKEKHYGF